MLTLSTAYQRPQPRIITKRRPFLLRTATIGPMGQLTRVLPRKACSTRAALIWRTLVDCIDSSFRDAWLARRPLSLPLHRGLLGRSCFGYGEDKQPLIWRRRTEEGEEIDQNVGGQFDGAGGMVDRLSRIIAHDERVRPQRLGAVRTGFVQAYYSRQQAVVVVDDEHLGVLLHNSLGDLPIVLVKKE